MAYEKRDRKLESVHPDLITTFLTTGEGKGIPEDVQTFLKQLQWAAEIYEYERNITRGARKLKQRIASQQKISLDVRTCMTRINQAISYFNVDCNVAIKVWENDLPTSTRTLPSSVLPSATIKCRKPVWTRRWNVADVRPNRQKQTEISELCSSLLQKLPRKN